METSIIKIGNSKGIRLSKSILEQYKIEDKVELIFEENMISIKPIQKPRAGWSEKFIKMNNNNDDELLIDGVFLDEEFED